MSGEKFRLVTRSDFDGLVCALLLKELGMISGIIFVHPKDVQEGRIDISEKDITTNLPYSDDALLVFDHHASETLRIRGDRENWVIDPNAPSAARVVWESFGGKERFPNISEEMLEAVDRADSAGFTLEQVLNPKDWDLLGFIMDARTGFGRFKHFKTPNHQLMKDLISHCQSRSIDDILNMPDVKERVELYIAHQQKFIQQLRRCTKVIDGMGIIDLRNEDTIFVGNRFVVYALFPEIKVSMHVFWGKQKEVVVYAVGGSIFNKGSKANIGEIMLRYGGGGHRNAGTCQIPIAEAEQIKEELIEVITSEI